MRHRPTPVHWKPHFSSTRREAGLLTRAPACSALVLELAEGVVDQRAHRFGGVAAGPR